MSSRLIEKCFEVEELGEEYYTWINFPMGTTLIIVDPYAIEMGDLKGVKPGRVSIVRARRPIWGRGSISSYIHMIKLGE